MKTLMVVELDGIACDCNEDIVSVRDRILEFSSFMIFARLFISLL